MLYSLEYEFFTILPLKYKIKGKIHWLFLNGHIYWVKGWFCIPFDFEHNQQRYIVKPNELVYYVDVYGYVRMLHNKKHVVTSLE